MNRILILASVASMIDQFNMSNIKLLQQMGGVVDVACNFVNGNTCSNEKISQLKEELQGMDVHYYQIDFARNITDVKQNFRAYKQVKSLMKNQKYQFVHCHSPIGGVIARIVGKMTGTKVIYTAHGFHFYKGAPVINWLLFYPVEKICSYFTDVLITINQEDYMFAKNKMKAKQVLYIPGVGIDLQKFKSSSVDKKKKRAELNIPEDSIILFSVGELNKNKNHQIIIKALAKIKNEKIHYCIAGRGEEENALLQLALSLGVQDKIHLLGFRTDVSELYQIADYFVFPSFREGLSVSLMEAMASGLPCAVSKIRGNVDLINEDGGTMFNPDSVAECIVAIEKLLNMDKNSMRRNNVKKIQEFSINNVSEKMRAIYENICV